MSLYFAILFTLNNKGATMQLLKSFFRKPGQTTEVNLDLNDLNGFLDIGGLSYIK